MFVCVFVFILRSGHGVFPLLAVTSQSYSIGCSEKNGCTGDGGVEEEVAVPRRKGLSSGPWSEQRFA